MRGEQEIIVAWMRRQLNRLRWNPERWAREASLSPTTVTRAMAANYDSVSSVTTLHRLARAAGCPSILDFLEGQVNIDCAYPLMATTLRELLPSVGCDLPEQTIDALADAVGQVIVGMAEQGSGACRDPELVRVLARAARGKLRLVVP